MPSLIPLYPHPAGASPIQPSQVGSFQGGPQYAMPSAAGSPFAAMGGLGAMGGSPLTAAVLRRLGLGGLGAVGAFQGGAPATSPAPTPTPPGAPDSGGGTAGGLGGWLGSHGDALKGIGGALQGAAGVYGMVQQTNLEKKRLRQEQETRDRARRDAEANTAALSPAYSALLSTLMSRMAPGAAPTGNG